MDSDVDEVHVTCTTHEECPNATVCVSRLAGDRKVCVNGALHIITGGCRIHAVNLWNIVIFESQT